MLEHPIICKHRDGFSDDVWLVVAVNSERTILFYKDGTTVDASGVWTIPKMQNAIDKGSWVKMSLDETMDYCRRNQVPTDQLEPLLGYNHVESGVDIDKNLRARMDNNLRSVFGD